MHPNHVNAVDYVMRACTDAVDEVVAEMEEQRAAIAEEAKRKAQEEEDARLEAAKKAEELERLNARIAELRGTIKPEEVGIMNDEGEDEIEYESASDGERVIHQPVSFRIIFIPIPYL
jgi:membrane protein involved in colicin uptake